MIVFGDGHPAVGRSEGAKNPEVIADRYPFFYNPI
jgi:hypothetical protein